MRLIFSIICIALVAGIAEYFFPWWIAALVTFIIVFSIEIKPAKAFLAGFLGIFLLWLSISLYKDLPNEHILSQRMAVLFKLPHYGLFLLVAALIGGIVGGLSGWSGALVRRNLFHGEK
jgi:hypothetical protein